MLTELLDRKVVVDFKCEFVAFGTLKRIDEDFIELKAADLHDLRDSESTREIYTADTVRTGIKRNRKTVLIRRSEILAIAALDEVALK